VPRAGPKKVQEHSAEFKLAAVRLKLTPPVVSGRIAFVNVHLRRHTLAAPR